MDAILGFFEKLVIDSCLDFVEDFKVKGILVSRVSCKLGVLITSWEIFMGLECVFVSDGPS